MTIILTNDMIVHYTVIFVKYENIQVGQKSSFNIKLIIHTFHQQTKQSFYE